MIKPYARRPRRLSFQHKLTIQPLTYYSTALVLLVQSAIIFSGFIAVVFWQFSLCPSLQADHVSAPAPKILLNCKSYHVTPHKTPQSLFIFSEEKPRFLPRPTKLLDPCIPSHLQPLCPNFHCPLHCPLLTFNSFYNSLIVFCPPSKK